MSRYKVSIIFLLLFSLSLLVYPNVGEANSWSHYKRGVELMNAGKYPNAIIELEKSAKMSPLASTYRKLAESYEKVNKYQLAAETYYKEADIFLKLGDTNTYLAVKAKGDALFTEVEVYTSQSIQLPKRTLAKYEPEQGAYVGAYIEQGDIPGNSKNRHDNFNSLTGKDHAVYFNYHEYGVPFPKQFAQEVKESGGAIQLALEPSGGLNTVKDNAYLRQFAKDAKASGIPIFLRFASEMNGSWVAWHGDPALYKQKFSLVSKIMKQEAPNVAMTWVPNSVPAHNIDEYYPGDNAVDWVGLNLYSVPVFNGDANSPAEHVNPLDLIDSFYQKYSGKKPMMIGEYASSHFTSAGNRDVTKFGITKMKMFYHGLQMKYPRVKAIHWFNVDTINGINIPDHRRLNNFSLLQNNKMLKSYKEVLKEPYFQSKVVNGPFVSNETSITEVSVPLNKSTVFSSVDGIGYAKTYDPYISKIVYKMNGSYLSESNQYPFKFHIDHGKLRKGKNQLEIVVFDSKGKEASRKSMSFTKGPHLTKTKKDTLQLFIDEKTVFNEYGALQLYAPVYMKNGRSFVPLRFISETLGASVQWDGKKNQITIKEDDKTIVLTEGSKSVKVNQANQMIDVGPEIKNGTTFVPLRFITEVLGATVDYQQDTKGINIQF